MKRLHAVESRTVVQEGLSFKTKGRIYEALVQMILFYGCETLPVRVEDLRRLEVFENDCLGSIF